MGSWLLSYYGVIIAVILWVIIPVILWVIIAVNYGVIIAVFLCALLDKLILVKTSTRFSFVYRDCVLSCFSHVQLFTTPQTVAHQAPLSMGFSRQEYWSGLPFPCLSLYIHIYIHTHTYRYSFFRCFSIVGYYKILNIVYALQWKWKWSRSVKSDSLRPHGL